MARKRIYKIAKELGVDNKIVVEKANQLGFAVKSHMSSLDETQVEQLKLSLKKTDESKKAEKSKTVPVAQTNEEKPKKSGDKDKDGKIKVSITSIRKNEVNEVKNIHSNNHEQKNSSLKQNQNNVHRSKRRSNGVKRSTNAQNKRPAARDLLDQLKHKQRGEQITGNKQVKQVKKEYKQRLNDTTSEKKAPAKSANTVNKKPTATTTKMVGPKILKPSPARLKKQQAENITHVQAQVNKPASPSSIREKDNHSGNRRNRNFGKPGRKGQNQFANGNNSHSDRKERRKRKNKKRQFEQVPKKQPTQRKERPLPETLLYEEGMNAQDLGKLLHREVTEVVKKLFMLGVMTNQNQSLDRDTIELLAAEYGIEAQEKVHEDISDIDNLYAKQMEASKASENQSKRPPVVTIMGHVDHGKTTLLDRLRHTHVSAHEAGGITQKIGAYQVKIQDQLITFLDTPGHAAFSDMRERGAEITDIVVLVVAADDGVMPQTIEAIDHAKSAGVPIIVAINKMDVQGANPQHVTEQLMKYNLIPESYGGDTIFVNISAKTGENVDELLQMILLQADVLELKADSDQPAIGTVIEARLSRGRGPVADLLIQQGTLHTGDPIVIGNRFGRIRVMTNDRGQQVSLATPSMPVEVTGLNDVPESADKLVVFADEKTARSVGEQRAQQALQKSRENVQHVTLDNLFDTMKRENMKEVDVILKADVQGSVEALQQSLEKIEVEGVRVNIIHAGVGAINESDVTLAAASNAFIIGFNVRPTAATKSQADVDGVDIRLYSVIYKAIDDVKAAMQGMLEPTYEDKVTGTLTVRELWKVSKVGTIAGSFVDSGYITRDSSVNLIRNGVVIYTGKIASLKRFKEDAKKVKQGYDCGLTIEDYNDIKVDDQLEAFEKQEVKPK